MDDRILELCREDPRFLYEAYEFICDAVTYTQNKLHRAEIESGRPEEEHHVSGEELLRGTVELAIREFGMMAPVVFKHWGVRSTHDVGVIVFKLIDIHRLSKSDRDDLDDFHDVFDLHQALAENFALTLNEATAKRGTR